MRTSILRNFFAIALIAVVTMQKDVAYAQLKTEYLTDPLSLALKNPHFSWKFASQEKNIYQKFYQIIVSNGTDEMWNSGKVESDQSVGIEYKGKQLNSNQSLIWKLMIWDNFGKSHDLGSANFSTGLMELSDWKAKWIHYPVNKDIQKHNFDPSLVAWIWFPEPNNNSNNPTGTRYFKQNVEIKDLSQIQSIQSFITGDDFDTLYINGAPVCYGEWLKVRLFEIKKYFVTGNNSIVIKAYNRWGGAGVIAQLAMIDIHGKINYLSTDKNWQASNDNITWQAAKAFANFGEGDGLAWLKKGLLCESHKFPPTYLRKVTNIQKKIKSAKLYTTALGWYFIEINGKKISDHYFSPGFTDYSKRVLYQSFDVKDLLKMGDNTIGAIVADGWYAGSIGWGDARNHYGIYPEFLAQIQIEYQDGSSEIIATDQTWKTSYGSILYSDILDGEIQDKNLEFKNWTINGFDDKNWKNVTVRSVNENIRADNGVPVKEMKEIKPISIFKSKNGSYIYDLGQNMVGIVGFIARSGQKGDTITMRFSEMLKDSLMYMEALRTAEATDKYILRGESQENLQTLFTFHGFRYVEIIGSRIQPALNDLKGKVIHSDMAETGSFECSNPLINQIYKNAKWGQRGNFLSVPTDCPQRDERLGWMGDAQVFVKTAAFNFDVVAFFNKWMVDVIDAQSDEGAFSDVAPRIVATGDGAPAWGDAGIIVPLAIYNAYNNKDILSQHYQAYVKWVEYVKSANPNLIWANKMGGNYSDWLNTSAITKPELLATAFFAHSTSNLSKIATIIGKKEDAEKYSKLFEEIKQAFVKEFVDVNGRIKDSTQTAFLLPVAFNLLDEKQSKIAMEMLVENIKKRDMHHSTGFVGIGHLLPTLTNYGYTDIAYKLISNNTFPSLGYMVENGATTIWERWDGYVKGKGFQDAGMNSFNHYSLGSPVEWLYTYVGGIQLIEPGYKKFKIKPYPGGNLSYANTSFESIYGLIESKWVIQNGEFILNITVPANTTCTVIFPSTKGVKSELKSVKTENNTTIFEVGSGKYKISGKLN